MNIALIFAGGVGSRMKTNGIPKQFLKVNDKPILIHTVEKFELNKNIDAVIIVCVESWKNYCKEIVERFNINKVRKIVSGGINGQQSIYNGLLAAEEISETNKDIVLIHDGVRPLITDELITENINIVKEKGSCITCVECKETISLVDEDVIKDTLIRSKCKIARAPQSFFLKEILQVHRKAIKDGNLEVIDSCTLMKMYGKKLYITIGESENIKITTPDDYFVFEALLKSKMNSEVFGDI